MLLLNREGTYLETSPSLYCLSNSNQTTIPERYARRGPAEGRAERPDVLRGAAAAPASLSVYWLESNRSHAQFLESLAAVSAAGFPELRGLRGLFDDVGRRHRPPLYALFAHVLRLAGEISVPKGPLLVLFRRRNVVVEGAYGVFLFYLFVLFCRRCGFWRRKRRHHGRAGRPLK